MQKLYILSIVSLSLFSCGTTQLADDSEPDMEQSTETTVDSGQELKVIEVESKPIQGTPIIIKRTTTVE